MRVLYLTPGCFDKGGISRYCRYQIAALRELLGAENVRVYSVLGPDAESFEEPFAIDWYAGGISRRRKAEFVARTLASAVAFRPDVIVVAHVNLSALAVVAGRLVGAATVLNTYGIEVWSGFRRDVAWGLGAASHVVSDCEFTASYLESNGLRPRGSVAVLWDCVDLDKFTPGPPSRAVLERHGIPDPATHVNLLTLGRIKVDAAHKGYERLLAVFAKVAAAVPSLRLVYAGGGDLVPALRRTAGELGLGDRVVFCGCVAERDLADVYRSAHLFSLVSDRGVGRGEGIPLTPLEAAACGVPILVGNQDGSREAAVDGEGGFVLDPFDLDAHADRVRRLAEDSELRARMSRAALARARAEFAYPRFVQKHRSLLERWASRKGDPRA